MVYRMTMILGASIIAFQFGGEVFYAKFFRDDRDLEIKDVSRMLLMIDKLGKD